MKKLFVFISLIFLISLNADAGFFIQKFTADGGSCSTTNVTFWWRAEEANFSGSNGTTDYSAGDDIAENKIAI